MDPNQVLDNLLEAISEGDRDNAIGSLDCLSDWLKKGGFMPDINETNLVSDKDERISNLREQLAKQSSMATS